MMNLQGHVMCIAKCPPTYYRKFGGMNTLLTNTRLSVPQKDMQIFYNQHFKIQIDLLNWMVKGLYAIGWNKSKTPTKHFSAYVISYNLIQSLPKQPKKNNKRTAKRALIYWFKKTLNIWSEMRNKGIGDLS